MLTARNLVSSLVLGTILTTLALKANAGEPVNVSPTLIAQTANQENLADVFNRAFYHDTGRFYEQNSILGQLNNIFGWREFPMGSYPDNMIADDAKVLEALYDDVLKQQTDGPLIRTQDLPNPFDTSLQENPNYISPSRP